ERDHTAPCLGECGDPGRIRPVDVLARCKTVHEKNRFAFSFVEISDFNGAVVKTRHGTFQMVGRRNWRGVLEHDPEKWKRVFRIVMMQYGRWYQRVRGNAARSTDLCGLCWRQRKLARELLPFSTLKHGHGRAFGGGLDRGQEPEQGE